MTIRTSQRIALIPGDGIGVPVLEAAMAVAEAAAPGLLEPTRFPWSCEHYLQTGRMMPEDG
ncbi:tartrate dehydrogenase, partial [Paracoccus sp. PAR01]|nr:tartrate dehydrogenase [Paracoccus sp. PAR01]